MSLGLQGTLTVLQRLDLTLPEEIIHVAGSNGKGTVCAIMAASLSINGRKNVLFTSPHVARIEERVRINGAPISSREFDEALIRIHHAVTGDSNIPPIELTFFLSFA